jgi:hypothetical protein
MTRFTRGTALFALSMLGLTARLEGQVFGLPVRNAGVPTGLTLAADLGLPSGDAGKGWAVGASGTLGLGPLGVTGSVARWDPRDVDAFSSVGATANLKIFGGPLIPLSVTAQAGLAYGTVDVDVPTLDPHRPILSVDGKAWHFPLGVGFALTIPNPVLAIKPWVAPRIDVVRSSPEVGDSDTDSNFGVSGGIDLSFLSGLGIRAMYDRVWAGDGVSPSILSLGISWGLTVGR